MPVTEYLERNAREYPDEVALVELNPDEKDTRRMTWKEFGLIEPTTYSPYRREIMEVHLVDVVVHRFCISAFTEAKIMKKLLTKEACTMFFLRWER